MSRGGCREGAGRPRGGGKYGEATKAVRIPLSCVDEVLDYVANRCYRLALYQSAVAAGFPSPADDEIEQKLDLNEHLVKRPASTFFVKVSGNSMLNAGIHDGDILVVDRSLEAKSGKIVIAAVNGELTVKRLWKQGKRIQLLPENEAYSPIEISEGGELHIWGVVTSVIHQV